MENKRIRKLIHDVKKLKSSLKASRIGIFIMLLIIIFSEILLLYIIPLLPEGIEEIPENIITSILIAIAIAFIGHFYNNISSCNVGILNIECKIYDLGKDLYLTSELEEDNENYFKKEILRNKQLTKIEKIKSIFKIIRDR